MNGVNIELGKSREREGGRNRTNEEDITGLHLGVGGDKGGYLLPLGNLCPPPQVHNTLQKHETLHCNSLYTRSMET